MREGIFECFLRCKYRGTGCHVISSNYVYFLADWGVGAQVSVTVSILRTLKTGRVLPELDVPRTVTLCPYAVGVPNHTALVVGRYDGRFCTATHQNKGLFTPKFCLYLARSVKTISRIPYTKSNGCPILSGHGPCETRPHKPTKAERLSGRGYIMKRCSTPLELPPRPVVRRFTGGAVPQRSRGNTTRPAPSWWGDRRQR